MNDQFNKLWDETLRMLAFEVRRKGFKPVSLNKSYISVFYREKIIKDLWFSRTFSNDYNEWLFNYFPQEKEQLQIRDIMETFNPKKKPFSWNWVTALGGITAVVGGCVLLPLKIVSIYFALMILLFGIAATIYSFIMWRNSKDLTTLKDIEAEMERIRISIQMVINK